MQSSTCLCPGCPARRSMAWSIEPLGCKLRRLRRCGPTAPPTCARRSACAFASSARRWARGSTCLAGTPKATTADRFDAHCDHLIVRVLRPDGNGHDVVGTYRVLTPDAARRAGGFYSETEFDTDRLAALRTPAWPNWARSCIDPAWRTGGTILALWSALGEFMLRHGLDVAFGCASVDAQDGGHRAASLWRRPRGAAPRAATKARRAASAAAAQGFTQRHDRRDAGADPRLPALRRRATGPTGAGRRLRHRRPTYADDAGRLAATPSPSLSRRGAQPACLRTKPSQANVRTRA